MSSTILYKFRSGQTFEALPLPGSAARLVDVKKAIVKAKKLDQGAGLEFDLSVKDATTNQEYVDETMVLPRGTRVIVQRLPAARGHGFLARMARADAGFGSAVATTTAAPSGFYTIDSRNNEEEEFVSTSTSKPEEEKELAALMAVTDPGTATGPTAGGFRPAPVLNRNVAGSGPPPPRGPAGGGGGGGGGYYGPSSGGANRPARPNADPELREQERMPKKRATGIPRTFLNLSAPPVTDGSGETTGETARLLQPNTIGFEELVNRGGGQSETITGTKRDLDYALKLTSTDIPEHLQCGICHGVVKNAMLLPWDMEGRTACESCIRSALTESGFRCPLTGMEGVSPDDLHPNHGLRKAADLFIKGVMEKMDEIDRQQVDEPDTEETTEAVNLEGESGDRGAIVSRRTMKDHSRRNDDDPFGGGDDDFGGDVFDVAPDEAEDEGNEKDGDGDKLDEKEKENETTADSNDAKDKETVPSSSSTEKAETQGTDDNSKMNKLNQSDKAGTDVPPQDQSPSAAANDAGKPSPRDAPEQKRAERRRGPPAGYTMGPAGGAAVRGARRSPELDRTSQKGRDGPESPYAGGRGGRGDYFGSRGGGRTGDRFHGRGRYGDDFGRGRGRGGYDEANHHPGEDASRGGKRSRSESEDFGGSDDRSRQVQGRGGGRGWSGDGRGRFSGRGGGRFEGRGRGGFEGRGGRFDGGGRGSYRGRGPPFRGGRGRGRY